MKKIAWGISLFSLSGVLALIAIGLGQPHSHKCHAAWKIVLKENINWKLPVETQSKFGESDETFNTELFYPGFMNLIFQ